MSSRQVLFDHLALLRISAFRQGLEAQFASPQYPPGAFSAKGPRVGH